MKKIATLILAAGLVFGAATGASAIEFNAKGQWVMDFEYGDGIRGDRRGGGNTYGYNGADNFEAKQRIRLQLDAVASESLSGSIQFEMGDTRWGQASSGGALGTDGIVVEVKHAYIDWIVPDSAIKIRMGLQAIALPQFTFNSSQVFNDDVAGIAASYQFNENVGATFVWARPYNDNFGGSANVHDTDGTYLGGTNQSANAFDNLDVFALIVPMTFNNVKISPWAAYAMIGRNFSDGIIDTGTPGIGRNIGNSGARALYGMLPAAFGQLGNAKSSTFGEAYWVGLTGEITDGGAFRFAWDANYGSAEYGKSYLSREGYYLDALIEYKMDWGTPGLYAWYSSGDDGNVKNGSERMPSLSANGTDERSNFAGSGSPWIGREGVIAASNWTGTWGIGARLKDMSFMENLKHTLRLNYMVGTNSTGMAKYIIGTNPIVTGIDAAGATGNGLNGQGRSLGRTITDFNSPLGSYLTTDDSALEVGLTTTYKIYDNLTMFVDLEYIFLFMDGDVWDTPSNMNNGQPQANPSFEDPWNINVSFVYSF